MTRYILLLTLSLFTQSCFSQLLWFRDFKTAQTYALKENKLILMDFWATWCGPCRSMESELWSSEEFKSISDHFVTLKIDIDNNKALAMKYNVSSIPKVVVANVAGEPIIDKTGFSNSSEYMNILTKIPGNVSELNHALGPVLLDQKGDQINYQLALAYQELGRTIDHYLVKDAFLDKSNLYFKKVKGKDGDNNLVNLSELNQILNLAFRGKTKPVYKKLHKIDGTFSNSSTLELYHFIQAYCFKLDGDSKNFTIEKEKIKNEHYLSLLET